MLAKGWPTALLTSFARSLFDAICRRPEPVTRLRPRPAHADRVTTTYPAGREATIVLRDGSTLTVRPVRASDADELSRFFADLSLESRVFRFFAAVANADSSIRKMVDVD